VSKAKRVPTALAEPKPMPRKSPGKQKAPTTAKTVLSKRDY
jgi:hypothetical protein